VVLSAGMVGLKLRANGAPGPIYAGERLNGIQEVSGSIPLISTKNKNSCSRKVHEFLLYQHDIKERIFDLKMQRRESVRAGLLVYGL